MPSERMHPCEEAAAYKTLLTIHRYDVASIAAKVGRASTLECREQAGIDFSSHGTGVIAGTVTVIHRLRRKFRRSCFAGSLNALKLAMTLSLPNQGSNGPEWLQSGPSG